MTCQKWCTVQLEWYLFNEQYDYYAKKIKSMVKLAYNPYYFNALKNGNMTDDLHHYIFECLREEGYIEYVRKEVDRGSKK